MSARLFTLIPNGFVGGGEFGPTRQEHRALIKPILHQFVAAPARADVALPSIFTEHMVLPRDQPNRVWGRAETGEEVTVTIRPQRQTATADHDGRGCVPLEA